MSFYQEELVSIKKRIKELLKNPYLPMGVKGHMTMYLEKYGDDMGIMVDAENEIMKMICDKSGKK